jgi:two-component system, NtrC family, sensor kinase
MKKGLFMVLTALVIQAEALDPVVLTSSDKGTPHLGRRMHIMHDTSRSLSIEEIIGHSGFNPIQVDVPNLGITSAAHWLKLDVFNTTADNAVFLEVDHAEIEELDVHLLFNGRLIQIATTGQKRPNGSRNMDHAEFVFELPITSGTSGEVFLRVHSSKQLQVPVRLHTTRSFASGLAQKNLFIGGYIGIMLVLALYNLFIFISIRDRGYIIYVAYILLVTFTQLTFWGIGQYYLWGYSTWFSVKASIIFTFATAIAASEFMKHFIDTKNRAPVLHSGIKYFYLLFAFVMLFYLFLNPSFGYKLAQLSAGLFASYLFFTIFKVWRKGSRQAGYFLIAWTVFLMGTMVFTLKDMGVLPYNSFTVFTMPLGSAIEGILLSLALADRINILRREKEQSQAESLRISKENERIIREQNVVLEEKVKERTHALQESNEHLKLTQTQLVNAEKMASLGQLTAGIAHEINNPINFITSNINPLRRNITEIVEVMNEYRAVSPDQAMELLPRVREKDQRMGIQESIDELEGILSSIAEGSSRTAEIVRGLRNFSRLDESDLKESDLNEGIRNTLTVLAPQYRDRVEIDLHLGVVPKVECYPGKVNQVFMNILTNAVQATLMKSDNELRKVTVITIAEGDRVVVSISDNGVGMSDEVKARIFDPFFTTKPVGEGTGLGLAIVYGIIEDHHGTIAVHSTPGLGTEFRISLPIRHMQQNERRA